MTINFDIKSCCLKKAKILFINLTFVLSEIFTIVCCTQLNIKSCAIFTKTIMVQNIIVIHNSYCFTPSTDKPASFI